LLQVQTTLRSGSCHRFIIYVAPATEQKNVSDGSKTKLSFRHKQITSHKPWRYIH